MKLLKTCSVCGKKAMRLVTDEYVADLAYDGRTYSIRVPDLFLYRCETVDCRTISLPDESNTRVGRALRTAAGLLMPEEIRTGREQLGFSQEAFATFFRSSSESIGRLETGGQLQHRSVDIMLRALFDVPEFREYLIRVTQEQGHLEPQSIA